VVDQVSRPRRHRAVPPSTALTARRYNYVLSAAMDSGVAVSAVLIFFILQYPRDGSIGANTIQTWWGNTGASRARRPSGSRDSDALSARSVREHRGREERGAATDPGCRLLRPCERHLVKRRRRGAKHRKEDLKSQHEVIK
jgi:hypothetical protein